jgi:hypothetical protein
MSFVTYRAQHHMEHTVISGTPVHSYHILFRVCIFTKISEKLWGRYTVLTIIMNTDYAADTAYMWTSDDSY